MSIPLLSYEELLATLQKSTIPTIVVEGKDDIAFYRWLEEKYALPAGCILVCNSRETVLKLYNEKDSCINKKIVFLADKDTFIFVGIPEKYADVVWTKGYSIENDLFAASKAIDSLLLQNEKDVFSKIIQSISKWFAFEVENCLADKDYKFDHSVHEIINPDDCSICERFKQQKQFSEPNDQSYLNIYNEYKTKLRGKTLLDVYSYILNSPHRESKYSKKNIFELSYKLIDDEEYIGTIISQIKAKLMIA